MQTSSKNRSKAPKKSQLPAKGTQRRQMAPVAIGVTTKGRKPDVRTEGTDIVVNHDELFSIIDGATISVGESSTTNGANVRNHIVNPTESSVFPWLSAIADRYEKYRFESLIFDFIPMVGTSMRGQIVLSLDYDPADEMSTEPTMDTRMMLTSKPDSISAPVWEPLRLVCSPQRLNRVGERFVRNWAGELAVSGAVARTADVGVFSVGLFNTDESLSHVVYGDLRVRYRIRLINPQLQIAESNQPSEGQWELVSSGGQSGSFNLKLGELIAQGIVSGNMWRSGPALAIPLLENQAIGSETPTPHAFVKVLDDFEGRLALKGFVSTNATYTQMMDSLLPNFAAFISPSNSTGSIRLPFLKAGLVDEQDREYYSSSTLDGFIARTAMADPYKIKQRYELMDVTATSTGWELVLELVGRFAKNTVLTLLCNPELWNGSLYSGNTLVLRQLGFQVTPRASISRTPSVIIASTYHAPTQNGESVSASPKEKEPVVRRPKGEDIVRR